MKIQTSKRHTVKAAQRIAPLSKSKSKVETTYGHLLDLAHQLGPDAKMPTVRTLREDLNVSQATLDAALDRLEVQNVVVRRQGSGVYVSPGLRLRNVVLLCNPHFFLHHGASPFWEMLVDQIRDSAERNETRLSLQFLHPYNEDEMQSQSDPKAIPITLQEEIKSGAINGVITINVFHSTARWIESHGVPVVAFAGAAEYIIAQSQAGLIQMGVAALARQGCKRILPWFFADDAYPVYRGAMLAHALTPMPAMPLTDFAAPKSLVAFVQSFEWAMRLLVTDIPDAILFTDDMHAQSVLMAMHRLGLRAPKDVRIATHANAGSTALLGWHHEITRMEYDPAEIVRYLFETLDALMNGETPEWLPRAIRMPEYTYLVDPVLLLPE